ncbi:MAG: hypothetical protein JRJ35_18115 [Deltaproteobacteria bacterium]|nr:hypothetical protein [Deltaproteobacteria bacterium]MBW1933820.1 hypothetical protein [Deltaproteobacteria bacterium]MBW2104127.1 hypothetical protein [Deltaproteobacteria bacterium]RLB31815.1 MAG: hypothetical protein DRH11_12740 [Deltaproteobacteria bacterium]
MDAHKPAHAFNGQKEFMNPKRSSSKVRLAVSTIVIMIAFAGCAGREVYHRFYRITNKDTVHIYISHRYGPQIGSYEIPGTSVYLLMENPQNWKFLHADIAKTLTQYTLLGWFLVGPWADRTEGEYMQASSEKLYDILSRDEPFTSPNHEERLFKIFRDYLQNNIGCRLTPNAEVNVQIDSRIYLAGNPDETFLYFIAIYWIDRTGDWINYRIITAYYSSRHPLAYWMKNGWEQVHLHTDLAIKENRKILYGILMRKVEPVLLELKKTRDINYNFSEPISSVSTRPKGTSIRHLQLPRP